MRLFTHFSVDLDAVFSVLAVTYLGLRSTIDQVRVVFKPANWDGGGMVEGDWAVDLEAGGLGIKGEKKEDGTISSAFGVLVRRFGSDAEQKALRPWVTIIDAQDAYGHGPLRILQGLGASSAKEVEAAAQIFQATGINAVLRALQSRYRGSDGDYVVIERMAEVFEGVLEAALASERAAEEASHAEWTGSKVAIVRNSKEFQTTGILYGMGAEFVIYEDGNKLGVTRSRDSKVDLHTHEGLRRVVESAGEIIGDGTDEFFAHPAGFLFAWGTRKSEVSRRPRVTALELAKALA